MKVTLTEDKIRNIVAEALSNVIAEMGGFGSDMVKIRLISPVNGNCDFYVPFSELRAAKFKTDFLWDAVAKQHEIKLARNGRFMTAPDEPRKGQVDALMGWGGQF